MLRSRFGDAVRVRRPAWVASRVPVCATPPAAGNPRRRRARSAICATAARRLCIVRTGPVDRRRPHTDRGMDRSLERASTAAPDLVARPGAHRHDPAQDCRCRRAMRRALFFVATDQTVAPAPACRARRAHHCRSPAAGRSALRARGPDNQRIVTTARAPVPLFISSNASLTRSSGTRCVTISSSRSWPLRYHSTRRGMSRCGVLAP